MRAAAALLLALACLPGAARPQGSVCAIGGGGENYGSWSDAPYRWIVQRADSQAIVVLSANADIHRHYPGRIWDQTAMNPIGIDTHKYNGLMNYQTASNADAEFVLSRCGGGYTNSGNPFTDTQWVNNAANAPPIIPCFGAWWFMTGKPDTIVAQANHCADLLIPHKAALTLGFWLDCVYWLPGYTANSSRDMVLRFIDTFEARAQMPVRGIYTRQTIWDLYVTSNPRWSTLDLWAARYSSQLTGPWSGGYYRFRDWDDWRFWQYSADGNGMGQTYGAPPPPAADYDMDLDRWNGSLDELYLYANLEYLTLEKKVDLLWEAHPELHG